MRFREEERQSEKCRFLLGFVAIGRPRFIAKSRSAKSVARRHSKGKGREKTFSLLPFQGRGKRPRRFPCYCLRELTAKVLVALHSLLPSLTSLTCSCSPLGYENQKHRPEEKEELRSNAQDPSKKSRCLMGARLGQTWESHGDTSGNDGTTMACYDMGATTS